jgi:hypothetical protein
MKTCIFKKYIGYYSNTFIGQNTDICCSKLKRFGIPSGATKLWITTTVKRRSKTQYSGKLDSGDLNFLIVDDLNSNDKQLFSIFSSTSDLIYSIHKDNTFYFELYYDLNTNGMKQAERKN